MQPRANASKAASPAGECFEVVQVTRPSALIDAEYRERVYWRRDGVPLAGGYYVVSWPVGTRKRVFNEDARFRGPFRTRDDAAAAMRVLHVRAVRFASWRT